MALAVAGTTTGNNAVNTTTHTVTLSTAGTPAANDLLIVCFANDQGATASINSGTYPGWTTILGGGSSSVALKVFWYRAAGTGDPSSIVVDTSNSQMTAWTVYRISGASAGDNLENGTAATGTTASPDPPTCTPSWGTEDYLFIACYAANGNATVSGYPTNYSTSQLTDTNADATNGCGVASACRAVNTSSENPGTFSLSASTQWAAQTVVIRTAPAFNASWARGANGIIVPNW